MIWEVEYTDEFGIWWKELSEKVQDSIAVVVGLLEAKGPHLGYPYSSDIKGSKYGRLRELRIQHQGKPYRVFYAFDPRRAAVLLVGGCKTEGERWYKKWIPIADRLYEAHLNELKEEDLV